LNNLIRFIHISDIHFGSLSKKRDGIFKTSFSDWFQFLIDFIEDNYLIKNINTFLLISGDLISKSEHENFENEYLQRFLKIFYENKIPIIICNGNHDLDRKKINEGAQFNDFNDFMRKNESNFRINLSRDFNDNQISYYHSEETNLLFIAVNSCQNIEIKYKDEQLKNEIHDPDILLDEKFLDIGIISYATISKFFKELSEKFSEEYFKVMNKFIISHHTMNQTMLETSTFELLKKYNVQLIFSGHQHEYDFIPKKGIFNYVSGSLAGNYETRADLINLKIVENQFNVYDINFKERKIIPQLVYYGKDKKWITETKYEDVKEIELSQIYTFDYWSKNNSFTENIIKQLKEKNIKTVYVEENSYPPYYLKDSNNIFYNCCLLKNEDRQLEANEIYNYLQDNLSLIEQKSLPIMIINNTNKFQRQFPKQFTINK